jgi:hypothetical protein
MNQRRRIKRRPFAFPPEMGGREFLQLTVNERNRTIQCLLVTGVDASQQLGERMAVRHFFSKQL